MLALGLLVLIAAYGVLAWGGPSTAGVGHAAHAAPEAPLLNLALSIGPGILLWGLHMAMTQGLLAAMVADTAPVALRGTAYGWFNLVSGVAMLLSGAASGLLWDHWGPAATFVASAVLALLTLLLMALMRWRRT